MEIVFATHNTNKVREIRFLFPSTIHVKDLTDIGIIEEITETGNTIQENAIIKARFIYNKFKMNCFADDTGLEVDALNGRPGVYSARYAGDNKSAADNMVKLLSELKGQPHRSAKFKTCIAAIIDGKQYLFEGIIQGNIALSQTGTNGFGYDPIFVPEGYSISFAQMTLEEKNKLSHRAIAVNKLLKFLTKI